MDNRHEISDSHWELIRHLFPPENTGEGRPSKSNRQIFNGINWRNKTGSPWRDIPRDLYGPYTTIYTRYKQWCEEDVLARVFTELTDSESDENSIDSTSAKAHQHSAGAKKGAP